MQNEYCTLDTVSRKITLTEPQRIAGVESDENAKGLKFKFPKTVDSIDLTQMQVRINFMNSRQEKGQYIVTDLKPCEGEEDYITFTWPFSRLATKYRGLTKFVVCAVKTDEDGTIATEWNTALTQLRVLEGLEITQADFSPEEKDIVTQLISICQSSAETASSAVEKAEKEAEKVLTYGPEIGENGNWFVGGEDTGKPSRGEKGEQGEQGAQGVQGAPGKDGTTPEIGANGNWYISGEDTGKPSRGEKGDQGIPGDKGEAGAPGKDGITPTIGENGNWFIGGEDTGKPSRGASGIGLPETTSEDAGKSPVVNSEGTGYELQEVAGSEIWEEIGTIPLSPDIASYELGAVDEWEKLRLFITRPAVNSKLTGTVRITLGLSSALLIFNGGGNQVQQYDILSNNLYQVEGRALKTNNSLVGANGTGTSFFPLKGSGFGGTSNYNYKPGDKYILKTTDDPSICWDGTETARLYGVRRK